MLHVQHGSAAPPWRAARAAAISCAGHPLLFLLIGEVRRTIAKLHAAAAVLRYRPCSSCIAPCHHMPLRPLSPHLAAEAAEVLGVLANFDLLDLLPQRSAIAGAVLADDPDLLSTLRLQGKRGRAGGRAAAVRRRVRRLLPAPVRRGPRGAGLEVRPAGCQWCRGVLRGTAGRGRRMAAAPGARHRCPADAGGRVDAAGAARRPAAAPGAARACSMALRLTMVPAAVLHPSSQLREGEGGGRRPLGGACCAATSSQA